MEKKLLLDAAVFVDGELYFTAMNTHCLYRRERKTGKIYAVAAIATQGIMTKRFAGMFCYNNSIWMVPWDETYFWVYDLKKNSVKRFVIPEKVRKGEVGSVFRRAEVVEQYIWLIPNCADCLMRVDMENETFELFSEWPEGIKIDYKKSNFKNMSYDRERDCLYLFRDACSDNIIVDAKSGKMRKFKLQCNGEFAAVHNKRIVISPIKTGDTVRLYRLNGDFDAMLEKEIELSDEVWAKEEIYAYWHVEYMGNKWIILPHEAKKILILDDKTLQIDYVEVPQMAQNAIRSDKWYAGFRALKQDNEIWVFPYRGGSIIVLDASNNIKEIIELKIEEADEIDELEGLFRTICCSEERALWANEESNDESPKKNTIGKNIFNVVV